MDCAVTLTLRHTSIAAIASSATLEVTRFATERVLLLGLNRQCVAAPSVAVDHNTINLEALLCSLRPQLCALKPVRKSVDLILLYRAHNPSGKMNEGLISKKEENYEGSYRRLYRPPKWFLGITERAKVTLEENSKRKRIHELRQDKLNENEERDAKGRPYLAKNENSTRVT